MRIVGVIAEYNPFHSGHAHQLRQARVNMITKHTKPSAQNQNGGIVHQEAPIDISNLMYVHNGKTTRVGFKIEGDKKVRIAKSTGEVID